MSFQQPQPGYVVASGALVNPGGAQGPGGAAGDSAMVGAMQLYPTTTAPAGWMVCDGSALSRTAYPALFSLIGTTFGAGDGATTFNLPDFRSRFPLGAGQGGGLTNRVLAAIGGEENHALSIAELAVHNHTDSGHAHTSHTVNHNHGDSGHGHSDSGHSHTLPGQTLASGSGFQSGSGYGIAGNQSGASNCGIYTGYAAISTAGDIGTTTSTNAAAITNTGSGTGHNNMPPFVVVCVIIKVTQTVPVGATIPLADTTQPGLLRTVSGATTDYIGGDNTCHALPQPGASAGFITKSAAYTLVIADSGKYIICTGGSWTLTLPIAAVNLSFNVRNDQGLVVSSTITLQPQTGSTIDGQTSINLLPGQECTLLSDGTNWRTFGLQREVVIGSLNLTTVSSQNINLPAGYGYFEIEINRLFCSSVTTNLQMVFSADGVTFSSTGGYGGYIYNNSTTTAIAAAYTNVAQCYVTHWMETSFGRHLVNLKLQPGDASSRPAFIANSGAMFNAGNIGQFFLSGFYDVNGRIAAIQLRPSAGQFSAQIYVKGIV